MVNTNCYGLNETVGSKLFNTAELCKAACDVLPECQNALFVNTYPNNKSATDQPRCYLKKKISKCIVQQGQDSYIKEGSYQYVKTANPAIKKFWGCQISGTDPRSSTRNQKSAEALCTENAACVGYYGDDGGPWFIVTDTDPKDCKKQGNIVYKDFYKKTWT